MNEQFTTLERPLPTLEAQYNFPDTYCFVSRRPGLSDEGQEVEFLAAARIYDDYNWTALMAVLVLTSRDNEGLHHIPGTDGLKLPFPSSSPGREISRAPERRRKSGQLTSVSCLPSASKRVAFSSEHPLQDTILPLASKLRNLMACSLRIKMAFTIDLATERGSKKGLDLTRTETTYFVVLGFREVP